jgi:acyl-CoA synthetase (AMP-forming)/AMP-acid ligase II
MNIIQRLSQEWESLSHPLLISNEETIYFEQIKEAKKDHLYDIQTGDVVALIGDFDSQSISDLLELVNLKTIIVPLSPLTRHDHEYFFESALVQWVVENGVTSNRKISSQHALIESLRKESKPGLVLFSTGTTGRPKAILHDFTQFLKRFETPRPTKKTIAFLLFDHIGGINTLLHTLFNRGTIICTRDRSIKSILALCREYGVEVLPTTPTFLRMLLISGAVPDEIPNSLEVITYGTERMDEGTLTTLNLMLPQIDFRQTFGMSELGILRVKSESSGSLFMKIGGEGVSWRISSENVLEILSETRMLGYLNADSPFIDNGWYVTNDIVEVQGEYLKIVGRIGDSVNVAGLKFLLSEVELVIMQHPKVFLVSVYAKNNPISGQHVEVIVQGKQNSGLTKEELESFFREKLPAHMQPRRITLADVDIGHRLKKL